MTSKQQQSADDREAEYLGWRLAAEEFCAGYSQEALEGASLRGILDALSAHLDERNTAAAALYKEIAKLRPPQ